MKGWFQRLPAVRRLARRSRFTVPVLTLISGTVLAQGFAYAARPFLTRLFTPEDFGFLTLYAATVGVIASAATGRYEDAAMLPESDEDAWSLVRIALGLSLLVALASLGLVPFRDAIANMLGNSEAAPFLALVPFGVLAICWGRTLEVWNTRRNQFRLVSGARVSQSAVAVPTQLTSGVVGTGPIGLIAGQLGGTVTSVVVLGASAFKNRVYGIRRPLRELADRYRRFPLFSMPSGFLNTFSMQLPAFVLLSMFSVEAAGLFGVAFSSLAAPMQLVGASVARVFFVRAAEARRDGSLRQITESVGRRLALFGVFPLAAMMIVGPATFAVVFGEEWRDAGVYAQILAPWMLMNFVGSPLSSLYDVMERQATEFSVNALQFVFRFAGLVVGGLQGGPVGALIGFSAVSALSWLAQTIILFRWAGVSGEAMLSFWIKPALLSLAPAILLVLLVQIGAADLIQFGVATGLVALYLAAAYRLGRSSS